MSIHALVVMLDVLVQWFARLYVEKYSLKQRPYLAFWRKFIQLNDSTINNWWAVNEDETEEIYKRRASSSMLLLTLPVSQFSSQYWRRSSVFACFSPPHGRELHVDVFPFAGLSPSTHNTFWPLPNPSRHYSWFQREICWSCTFHRGSPKENENESENEDWKPESLKSTWPWQNECRHNTYLPRYLSIQAVAYFVDE